MQVDLIISNPPWVPCSLMASSNPLENATYDPNESFLRSALNFASNSPHFYPPFAEIHLSPGGVMLLVYSDFAQKIGIQDEDPVKRHAQALGLRAELADETKMSVGKKPYDPMKPYKLNSQVQLFKISK